MGWPPPVVTEYPWTGLGAHPIYWICVDALAVAKVVAEVRNWLHQRHMQADVHAGRAGCKVPGLNGSRGDEAT